MNTSLRLPVSDLSEAGEARRMAATWARARGCSAELMGSVALVVTELGKNLALHTSGGVLLLRSLRASEDCGVEVLSLDGGPGVANFGECLRDGQSSGGTLGIGLGAVRRASKVFDVHSKPGIGTALLSQLFAKLPPKEEFLEGAASVPLAGEEECGDSWSVLNSRAGSLRIVVADGLGHGPLAADAARKAAVVFLKCKQEPLLTLLATMDTALRSTRGAALAIAEIDRDKGTVSYAGVGNISATIAAREKRISLVSQNGTVGVQCRNAQQFTYPWTNGASLIMHSDGIKTSWNLDRYPGLSEKHPSVIAGVLYRDFHRSKDDATVAVIRGA